MYRCCRCRRCNSCNSCNCNRIDNTCNTINSNVTRPTGCGCGFSEENDVFPTNYMFGQSYVPIQTMTETFTPKVGLEEGTIYPELVYTYEPGQSMAEIEYLENANEFRGGCNNV